MVRWRGCVLQRVTCASCLGRARIAKKKKVRVRTVRSSQWANRAPCREAWRPRGILATAYYGYSALAATWLPIHHPLSMRQLTRLAELWRADSTLPIALVLYPCPTECILGKVGLSASPLAAMVAALRCHHHAAQRNPTKRTPTE